MAPRKYKIILFAVIAVGLFLRLNNLSSRSLWTDEFYTFFQSTGHALEIKNLLDSLPDKYPPEVFTAGYLKSFLSLDLRKGLKDVSLGLLSTDTHPPLYFWIIHIWIRLFGDSVFSVRFFSLFIGVLSIPLAYYICKLMFDRRSAFFGALFMSIGIFSVRYSQEARAYSLIMALGLLSCIFLLKFEKSKGIRHIFITALFNALGLYTHYFYLFVMISQLIYIAVFYAKDTKLFRRFLFAFLFSWVLFLPWFLSVLSKGFIFRNVEWIFMYPGLMDKVFFVLSGITRYFLFFDNSPAGSILFFAQAILFPAAICYGLARMYEKYRRRCIFCLLMFSVPIMIMFCIDVLQGGVLLRQQRFWTFSFIALVPVVGFSLGVFFLRFSKAAVLLVLLILSSACFLPERMQFGPAAKAASAWVNRESEGRSCLVAIYNIRSAIFAQAYYLDDRILLMPVLDERQLSSGIAAASLYTEKLFIARHFHRTDFLLMDQPFMAGGGKGFFKFRHKFVKADIEVTEYINAHYYREI